VASDGSGFDIVLLVLFCATAPSSPSQGHAAACCVLLSIEKGTLPVRLSASKPSSARLRGVLYRDHPCRG
jgi:hypothetical protein